MYPTTAADKWQLTAGRLSSSWLWILMLAIGCRPVVTVESLDSKYQQALNDFGKSARSTTDQQKFASTTEQLTDQALELIKRDEATESLKAALWLLQRLDADSAAHVAAAQYLLKSGLNQPQTEQVIGRLSGLHPVYEQSLRQLCQHSVSLKEHAQFELAALLEQKADYRDMIRYTPQYDSQRRQNLGHATVNALSQFDPAAARQAAEGLYQQVAASSSAVVITGKPIVTLAQQRLQNFAQNFPELNQPAPITMAIDLSGQACTLEQLKGKVVWLTFWASWCGPCVSHIPWENQLVKDYLGTDFVLIGLNGDQSLDMAAAAASKFDVQFPVWWSAPESNDSASRIWNVERWPTSYLIDRQGIVRYRDLDDSRLRKAIEELLNTSPAN